MLMAKQYEIGAEVAAICRKVGIAPEDVDAIHITPSSLLIREHLRDERGSKYLLGGDVAHAWHDFAVSTTVPKVKALLRRLIERAEDLLGRVADLAHVTFCPCSAVEALDDDDPKEG